MNKKIFLIISFTTVLILLIRCGQKDDNQSGFTKKWYFDNGNLKKVQDYSNDSIENGKYLYYYPSGALKDSAQIVNGELHGKTYEYYENGQLFIMAIFISGKERSGIVYYPNGMLKYYKASSYLEDVMYVVEYDSSGIPIKHDGSLIYNYILEDTVEVDKTFDFEMLVANPPNGITKVEVGKLNFTKKNRYYEYIPDKFNRVNYSIKPNSKENTYFLNVASFIDTLEDFTIIDSLIIEVDTLGLTNYYKSISTINDKK